MYDANIARLPDDMQQIAKTYKWHIDENSRVVLEDVPYDENTGVFKL